MQGPSNIVQVIDDTETPAHGVTAGAGINPQPNTKAMTPTQLLEKIAQLQAMLRAEMQRNQVLQEKLRRRIIR